MLDLFPDTAAVENGELTLGGLRAEELATRVQADAGSELSAQIRAVFQLCLSRKPADEELADARAFITAQAAARAQRDAASAERLALTDFCQSLFGLNEFIYLD